MVFLNFVACLLIDGRILIGSVKKLTNPSDPAPDLKHWFDYLAHQQSSIRVEIYLENVVDIYWLLSHTYSLGG
jgi:hypothetical protein